MPHIEWKDGWSIGISEIDAQHRRLVDLANRLFEALRVGDPAEGPERAVAELFAYSATHFADEEAYFARFSPKGYEQHVESHKAFMSKVADFEERLASGDPARIGELLAFLETWIRRHIAKEDRSLARLANRGTRG
jgi:hemerythrin-like metal-binding protein